MSNPFRYFNSSPEVIRLVVMMYVRYPLSLRNVEDLLAEASGAYARLSSVAVAIG
jgi:transposase-like protein